jgi:hypothetical protein
LSGSDYLGDSVLINAIGPRDSGPFQSFCDQFLGHATINAKGDFVLPGCQS